MRNLIRQINRRLTKEGQKLITSRSWRAKSNLGEFHIIEERTNSVVASHIDIGKLATEVGISKKAA